MTLACELSTARKRGRTITANASAGRLRLYGLTLGGGREIYGTSEVGTVYVVRLGQRFEVLTKDLNESCLATPAISAGTIYFRGQHHLFAIGGK